MGIGNETDGGGARARPTGAGQRKRRTYVYYIRATILHSRS